MKANLLFVAVHILWISSALAQIKKYTIQSFEGKTTTISLQDLGHETAIISCKKNKLVIHNFWALDTISVVKQKFLKIKYAVRGGSDLSLQNTLLLSVNKGKIIVPLFLFSEQRSSLKAMDSGVDTVLFDEKTLYQVCLSLSGNNINNYKVVAAVTDSSKSKVEHKWNYNRQQRSIFKFDKSSMVFCNGYTKLNNNYKIIENRYPLKSSIKTINGTFSSVLTQEPRGRYSINYYIDGRWYEKDGKKRLVACY